MMDDRKLIVPDEVFDALLDDLSKPSRDLPRLRDLLRHKPVWSSDGKPGS